MDAGGKWRLAPAFDLIYAWNPQGLHTGRHQMSMNRKRDNFEPDDFISFGRAAGIKPRKAKALVSQVIDSVQRWKEFAEESGVEADRINKIAKTHRLNLANV
jgi:serine/threonine-protein kinase HipA